jgi:hypothetical protein
LARTAAWQAVVASSSSRALHDTAAAGHVQAQRK